MGETEQSDVGPNKEFFISTQLFQILKSIKNDFFHVSSKSICQNQHGRWGLYLVAGHSFYVGFSKEEEKVPLKSLKDLEEEKAAEKKKQQRYVSLNKNLILQ